MKKLVSLISLVCVFFASGQLVAGVEFLPIFQAPGEGPVFDFPVTVEKEKVRFPWECPEDGEDVVVKEKPCEKTECSWLIICRYRYFVQSARDYEGLVVNVLQPELVDAYVEIRNRFIYSDLSQEPLPWVIGYQEILENQNRAIDDFVDFILKFDQERYLGFAKYTQAVCIADILVAMHKESCDLSSSFKLFDNALEASLDFYEGLLPDTVFDRALLRKLISCSLCCSRFAGRFNLNHTRR